MQYFLAIVGEFYDALPRWQAGQLDGVFGPQTREAVTAYQQLVGLPMTGAVDRETWYALLSTYQSVLLSQPEQEWLGQFVGLPETFLVKGMRGKAVRQAQQLINIIARGYAEVPAVAEDGIFGDATESSVASIQSLLGLPATGAIGPLTWEGMADLAENVLAGSPECCGTVPPAIPLERRQRDCTPMHKNAAIFSICRPFCGASSSLRAALRRSCRTAFRCTDRRRCARIPAAALPSGDGHLPTSAHGTPSTLHMPRSSPPMHFPCRRRSSHRRAIPC